MYIHKYKPHNLKDILYNKKFGERLSILSKTKTINNMLFYGPAGSGKKTFLNAYLADIYGNDIHNIRANNIIIKNISDIKYKNSNYHIEIDLSNYSSKNKKLLLNYIKEYSSTLNILTKQPKIIIFINADLIPLTIQYALRRILEIYYETARFIFISKSFNKIIEPLRSRLFTLRIRGINRSEAISILKDISIKEGIKINIDNINQIIENQILYNNIINIHTIVNNFNLSYLINVTNKDNNKTFNYSEIKNTYKSELDNIIYVIKNDKLNNLFFIKIKDFINNHFQEDYCFISILKYILFNLLKEDYSDEIKYNLINIISQNKIYIANKPTLFIENIIYNIVYLIRPNC